MYNKLASNTAQKLHFTDTCIRKKLPKTTSNDWPLPTRLEVRTTITEEQCLQRRIQATYPTNFIGIFRCIQKL